MKDKKKLIGIAIVFSALLPIAGGNLFLFFMDEILGYNESAAPLDYLFINVAMIVGIIIAYLLTVWRKRRNQNIPTADERTLVVMKNYFLYVLYFVFILSGLILLVLFFLGVQTIDIGAIFAYISLMIIVIGAGALVASKV